MSPANYDPIPGCAGCAQCCHFVVELNPFLDDVPAEFVVRHGDVACMDQLGDGACVALDPVTRLCTIYDRRPQTCRDFRRGEALCRTALIRRNAVSSRCSGPPFP